eukprot:9533863-Heterocapsa_arctica.AAC.1
MVAATEEIFVEKVVDPFIEGFVLAGITHKHDGDADLIRALLAILWTDAREACRPELPLALPAAAAYPPAGTASNKPPTTLAIG